MACRVPGVDLQACPGPDTRARTLNTKMDMASLLLKLADYATLFLLRSRRKVVARNGLTKSSSLMDEATGVFSVGTRPPISGMTAGYQQKPQGAIMLYTVVKTIYAPFKVHIAR